jgi:hypothetical protein
MMTLARAGLSGWEAYQTIQEQLDVPGLIDYMILNLYAGGIEKEGGCWRRHWETSSNARIPPNVA